MKLIKWVGGKQRQHHQYPLPKFSGTYYEPFMGAGTVFFEHFTDKPAVLADINEKLINFWRGVKGHPTLVAHHFTNMVQEYRGRKQKRARESYYYAARNAFNKGLPDPLHEAAMFLFLNRTAFNGVWRVNRAGEFNTPWGKDTRTSFPSPDLIMLYGSELKNTVLKTADFSDAVKTAGPNDFVYLDPPYLLEDATKFTAGDFGLADHIRLREVAKDLNDRGVLFLASNFYTPQVREIWDGFVIEPLNMSWAVGAGKGAGARRKVVEAVIRNYE